MSIASVNKIRSQEIVETVRDGLIVLSDDLTVEFVNQSFYRMFGVVPKQTIGRKLYDLGNGQWNIPALRTLLEQVVPTKSAVENYDIEHDFEQIGRRVIRINARTVVRPGNNVNQLLLVLSDITSADELEKALEQQRRLAQGIVDTIREPLLVLDGDLNVIAASRSYYSIFKLNAVETIGQNLTELGNGQWNIPQLRNLLNRILPDNEIIEDFEVDHEFTSIGRRQILLNAHKIFREGDNTKTILLAMEDITDRRRLEAEREAALVFSRDLLEELNHRVMNSLAMIGSLISMESRNLSDDECRSAFSRMQSRVRAVGDLYKSLALGKSVDSVSAQEYLGAIAGELVKSLADPEGMKIDLELEIDPIPLSTKSAVPLGLMLNELVINSFKYAFKSTGMGKLRISLTAQHDRIEMAVADNGDGIDDDAVVNSGLGSRLIEAFTEQLDGRIERESGSWGTLVKINFPI